MTDHRSSNDAGRSAAIEASEPQPFHEPLRATLTRTLGIALVGGAVLAIAWGGIGRFPAAFVLMLWPALGGHFVELWFLNWLRPRLPRDRGVQIAARLAVWLAGGIVLGAAMRLTAAMLRGVPRGPWRVWWIAGLGFVAIELVVHAALALRRRPNAFDGRG